MELEKVVKERDELNIKIAKWEESSKSFNILLSSQMSAHDKNGLGYGTQLNEMSDKSETDSEISVSVFEVRSSNEESTPANDRFTKADRYHIVPPPIIGNFLTPRADISFVDDEDDVSEISPVKTNETQTAKTQVDKIGQTFKKAGIGFKKIKACFVWWSNQYGVDTTDLTVSRPDIMFAVCACARFQVNPKASHLHAEKRIFSDYRGASLDRKSTTGGCQFLGRRLISWQCKKQTIMANSTTEAEYVVAANCCGQVLWIQNQMMDYGFN
ncbi:hypothetical protein Tco_0636918 [Tanacetum coccineum]